MKANTIAVGISIHFRVIAHMGSSNVCLAVPAVQKLSDKKDIAASMDNILQCVPI